MSATQNNTANDDRLSLSFHRSFALSRSGVSAILKAAVAGEEMSWENVRQQTSLGTVQVEAMPRYAERCGLLDSSKKPTAFGEVVAEKDPTLSHLSTQWCMHYFISTPERFRPNFWSNVVTNLFFYNQSFQAEDVATNIRLFAVAQSQKEPSIRTANDSATALAGTYTKDDALGALGILENNGGVYAVREPKPVPVGAFACILAHYWASVWHERDDVLLRDVNDGELSSLLLLSSGEINDLLSALSERGLVTRHRRVPPFKVTRQWGDQDALWREHLYS